MGCEGYLLISHICRRHDRAILITVGFASVDNGCDAVPDAIFVNYGN